MAAIPHAVKLNGVDYAIDPAKFQHSSIEPLREGAVTSNEPTDSLFNADAAWSRYRYSWHRGAGQVFDDLREDADPFRFATSRGVEVFTEGQLELLPALTDMLTLTGTLPTCMVAVRSYLYVGDNTSVKRIDSAGTVATLTAPGGNVRDMATDGIDVYVATDTNLAKYEINSSSEALIGVTNFVASDIHKVAFVANRLLIGVDNVLKEVTSGGVAANVYTHFQAAFRWTTIFAVGSRIYVGGYAGDHSQLYTVTTTTAGALVLSAEAAPFPPGELLTAGHSYAGIVLLGTSKGLRLAEVAGEIRRAEAPSGAVFACRSPRRRSIRLRSPQ